MSFAVDWAAGGREAIARVRMTDPSMYMRVVASILPKDVLQQATPGGLDAEAWSTLRRLLDLIQAAGANGEPGELFEMIELDLRARLERLLADLARVWEEHGDAQATA